MLAEYELAVDATVPVRAIVRDFSRYGQRRMWTMPSTTDVNAAAMISFLEQVRNGTISMDEDQESQNAISSGGAMEPGNSVAKEDGGSDDPYDEL